MGNPHDFFCICQKKAVPLQRILQEELAHFGERVLLNYSSGSVCDYSKGVAASVNFAGDYWQEFWLDGHQPGSEQKVLPVGCILTMYMDLTEEDIREILKESL